MLEFTRSTRQWCIYTFSGRVEERSCIAAVELQWQRSDHRWSRWERQSITPTPSLLQPCGIREQRAREAGTEEEKKGAVCLLLILSPWEPETVSVSRTLTRSQKRAEHEDERQEEVSVVTCECEPESKASTCEIHRSLASISLSVKLCVSSQSLGAV